MAAAARPPMDARPPAISAAVVMHAGHMVFRSFLFVEMSGGSRLWDSEAGVSNGGSDKCGGIRMDSLITAAARALAAGDPLGALNRVALRDDAAALALRGIAMAQLGDLLRAKALLRRARKSTRLNSSH